MDDQPQPDPMEKPAPLGGLDPADLLRQGAAGDTLFEKAPPFVPPSIEELAAIFPRFEILGLIGSGGMGAVYQVQQRDLDRIAALKILPPAIGAQPGFSERFTREAKALARLNHPGIVTLYEFGQAQDLYFFLMEYVDGANLRQLMERQRLSAREAMAIVPQICDALQYAHDQGVVHRDIKPENLLLDRRGHLKIADFGIARLVGTDRDPAAPGAAHSACLTAAGGILGTPAYMAPEQQENPDAVDHRADIYAVGVVFYQMLTGELPGTPLHAPSRTVRLDVRLDEVVLRALEQNPERRYPQVGEMKTQVETIAATPLCTTPAGNLPTAPNSTSPITTEARLSRLALAGLIWACLFPFVAAYWFSIPVVDPLPAADFMSTGPAIHPPPDPPYLTIAGGLLGCLSIVAALAPFGTTILGWMAVSRIRRSNGRLYGLPLAVFDGLFFVQALGTCVLLALVTVVARMLMAGRPDSKEYGMTALVLLGILALIDANIFTTRRVWHAVNSIKPTDGEKRGTRLRLILWFTVPLFVWLFVPSAKLPTQPSKTVWSFTPPAFPTAPTALSPSRPRVSGRSRDSLLAEARTDLEKARIEFDDARISEIVLEAAEDRVAIREAEASGSTVRIAEIKLACARRHQAFLLRISGKPWMTPTYIESARVAVSEAEAALRDILTAVGQPIDQPFFGPVIERHMWPHEQRADRCYLDLESGSFAIAPEPTPLEWKRETGVDLRYDNKGIALWEGRRADFISEYLPLEPITDDARRHHQLDFEMATAADVKRCLGKQPDAGSLTDIQTSAFQTREGSTGVIQILKAPYGVDGLKVRYKLVQQPPSPL